MAKTVRVIGLDPGLLHTGWGIVDLTGTNLKHVANGVIEPDPKAALADRLCYIYDGLRAVIEEWSPHLSAVEETIINAGVRASMKLGQARGIALLVPALAGLPVAEYAPLHIKKSVVGTGYADKKQVKAMVKMLLPGVKVNSPDAVDALAIAICHAHHTGGGYAKAIKGADV